MLLGVDDYRFDIKKKSIFYSFVFLFISYFHPYFATLSCNKTTDFTLRVDIC